MESTSNHITIGHFVTALKDHLQNKFQKLKKKTVELRKEIVQIEDGNKQQFDEITELSRNLSADTARDESSNPKLSWEKNKSQDEEKVLKQLKRIHNRHGLEGIPMLSTTKRYKSSSQGAPALPGAPSSPVLLPIMGAGSSQGSLAKVVVLKDFRTNLPVPGEGPDLGSYLFNTPRKFVTKPNPENDNVGKMRHGTAEFFKIKPNFYRCTTKYCTKLLKVIPNVDTGKTMIKEKGKHKKKSCTGKLCQFYNPANN